MDLKIDGINVFNPLEGKIDNIIEAFVKFYGEKPRRGVSYLIILFQINNK